jgi:xanthosine utilization system XapX-like protein
MSEGGSQPGMFEPQRPGEREPRSPVPWIVAAVGVIGVLIGLIVMAHRPRPTNPGGAGMAAADPYASSLTIGNLQMSQAGSMSGGQNTYIDGQITNKGQETVTAITVQIGFTGFTGQLVGKPVMALALIRTREPYVDTEPVRVAPILPGQTRDFRLILDSVPPDWNQNYPEIRVIQVTGK